MTDRSYRVAVVMPVYDEEDGIETFLRRIDLRSIENSVVIVCIDDASRDSSVARVSGLRDTPHPVVIVEQGANRGHGPSTVRAWTEGLALGAEWIVSTDSDGHLDSDSLCELVREAIASGADVVEGQRGVHSRSLYRRVVSGLLPILLLPRSRSWSADANTPYRVYRRESLERLRRVVPADSMIPNLWVTVVARRMGMHVVSVGVETTERSADGAEGSSWRATSRVGARPNRRFMEFCSQAMCEWLRAWPVVRCRLRNDA